MQRERLEEIRQALNLDKEKCTLFPLTDKVLRIFFDDKIKQQDINLIQYKMSACCNVRLFNPYTLDVIRKNGINSIKL